MQSDTTAAEGGKVLKFDPEALLESIRQAPSSPPAGENGASSGQGTGASVAASPATSFPKPAGLDRNLGEARPWLSLAVIVGNEAHHIGRFLQAFVDLVDELVIVRAIGSKEPDRTLDIAAELWPKPLRLAEYSNSHATAAWPHVDHFANARNRAFGLARGRFVMWADLDDIIDRECLTKLRSAVDLGDFDALFCHYRVVGAPPLMRERVIRKELNAPWVNAVHEAISIPQKIVPKIRTDIEILHLPIGDGQGGNKAVASLERNLRILDHEQGPAALTFFYLHRDSLLMRRPNEALKWGKLAIATENLTPAERYRVLYNMAKIYLEAGDFAQAETFCLNAMRLAPDRREALCIMSLTYTARQDWRRALHWIQLARCINPPELKNRPNWYEESWWGWQANLHQAFIARKLKAPDEARKIEDSEHQGHPMFSLLHATRGRPERALAARDQWFRSALMPGMIEHIFAVDADDAASLRELDGFNVVVIEPGGGCVAAWNAAAAASRGRVLIQMSDDWTAPHHWDNAICWAMKDPIEKNREAVLAISDGHRADKLLCMAILTRKYYRRQRHERTSSPYLFHPDYKGVYSDNEFTVRAYENGVVIEAKEIIFSHDHPIHTGDQTQWDETYRAQNSEERYAEGLATFNRRNPRYKIEPAAVTAEPAK